MILKGFKTHRSVQWVKEVPSKSGSELSDILLLSGSFNVSFRLKWITSIV